MKTKIPHLILAGLFATTLASQGAATLINVDDANNTTGGTATLGTLSLSTGILNNTNNAALGYTITGLDLDGIGGNNDNVVINFLASSSTGNISTRPLSSGTGPQLGTSDGANGSFLNGDSSNLEITFSDISVNLNGGSNNGWAAFNGFYELNLSSFSTAGEETNINGVLYTVDGGNSNPFAISGNTLAIDLEPNGEATTAFRLANWSFSFSAVPEPSSTALLGLGGLALMLRRKRS